LDFIILNRELDYSQSEISRKTNLSSRIVARELETLLDEGVIKITRKLGKTNMYKLNYSKKVRGLVQCVGYSIKLDYELLAKAIPSAAANANIPQPYNENDVLVWTRRILKSVCKENKRCFYPSEFILSDEMQGSEAYHDA
jgi:DNA-binding Lrp family transcriptional regulator